MENEQPTIYFYPSNHFQWTKLLTDNWKTIQQELQAVMHFPASNGQAENWLGAYPDYVASSSKNAAPWKTYEFLFFGIQQRRHCAACPQTYTLLQQIPALVTAQFSLMEGHTHIQPHKGYTRMVLRCHLPLIIPSQQQCALRVGNQTRHWEMGKMLIFNDSYEHEAWNKTPHQRAILMLDVANPAWPYTAKEICHYKLKNTADPFLLNIANNATWLQWLEQGYMPDGC